MINPETLLDALVTTFRAMPTLVTALGGDATDIRAYKDAYPEAQNIQSAIYGMTHGGMLVTWEGTASAGQTAGRELWEHSYACHIRAAKPADVCAALMNTVPTGGSLPFLLTRPHVAVHRIARPSFTRARIMISADPPEFMDYFQARFVLVESGSV